MDFPNFIGKPKKDNTIPDEKTGQAPEGFGNVVDALHNKGKLSSLRSYQGDMAEFIKERNESTLSISVKEKERKEKMEEEAKKKEIEGKKEQEKETKKEEKREEKEIIPLKVAFEKPYVVTEKKEGFKINFTILMLSVLLIGGGTLASLYIFQFLKRAPQTEVVIKTEVIPYNNSVTLANLTRTSFGPEISGLPPSNGVTIFKISDTGGSALKKTKDLMNFLGVSLPGELDRTLKDEYATGVISRDNQTARFLVLSVNDFGQAFSGMLDWEEDMPGDLSFITETSADEIPDARVGGPASTTAALASRTPSAATVTTPVIQGPFGWKDLIIKNKDTRGLANSKNQAKIAYTFLDKNTILITNSLWAIGEISSSYASRSVAR